MAAEDLKREKLKKSINQLFNISGERDPQEAVEDVQRSQEKRASMRGGLSDVMSIGRPEDDPAESRRRQLERADVAERAAIPSMEQIIGRIRQPAVSPKTEAQREKLKETFEKVRKPSPVLEEIQTRLLSKAEPEEDTILGMSQDTFQKALVPAITTGLGYLFGGFEGGAGGAQAGLAGLKAQREADAAEKEAAIEELKHLMGVERLNVLREGLGVKGDQALYDALYKGDVMAAKEAAAARKEGRAEQKEVREEAESESKRLLREAQAEAAQARAEAARARAKQTRKKTRGVSRGRALSATATRPFSDAAKGIKSIRELKTMMEEGSEWMGPIAGFSAKFPYATEARNLQAKINGVRQVVGKALEGGVLRKEDEEKYKKILPTMTDTPDVAQAKVKQLVDQLSIDLGVFLDTQEASGFDVRNLRKMMADLKKGGPKVGTVKGGYRFKGGDPGSSKNWEKVR